jgi:hypothetical protein
MVREKRKISEADAYIYASEDSLEGMEEDFGGMDFEIIKTELKSANNEDGGGHYTKILKEKSTGKFFEFNYCDWDIENTEYNWEKHSVDGRCDLDCTLREVYLKTRIIEEYR